MDGERHADVYLQFKKYLETGKAHRACRLFRRFPFIAGMLGPSEIIESYRIIRGNDLSEADYFINLISHTFDGVFKEIEKIDKSWRVYENKTLESDLKKMDKEHQDIVKRMRGNTRNAKKAKNLPCIKDDYYIGLEE